ncbi:MAG: trypsin-like peptidase domain-containing protein [Ruminococcus sp.]
MNIPDNNTPSSEEKTSAEELIMNHGETPCEGNSADLPEVETADAVSAEGDAAAEEPANAGASLEQSAEAEAPEQTESAEIPSAPDTAPFSAPYAPPYEAPQPTPAAPPYQPQAPQYQGAQPHPGAPQYYYPSQAPAPKKRSKGATAFMICLWVLLGLFSIGFFVLCGYVGAKGIDKTGTTAPTLYSQETQPTKPEENPGETQSYSEDESVIPNEIEPGESVYSSEKALELNSLPSDKSNSEKYNTKYAYNKVAESTVTVICYRDLETGKKSQGTGIIITEDGYIVTNSHVILDSRDYVTRVVTVEGTTYEAIVVGFDSRTDLAVLKINGKNLTPAEFCDSSLVEIGDDVIAVGNPGGINFQNSLTKGIVSAVNRELSTSPQVTYIQTDAAINPGNSGGPLSNIYGQVIGINTAKISSEAYEGMGFAIPSTTVKEIVDDLISQGYVSNRVRIGISGQAVSSTMSDYYNVPKGILVGEIAENGPCDGTELKVNDIIYAIDGDEVESFKDVYAILGEHQAGDKVTLSVYRMETQNNLEIEITLMADEGQTQE